jgi:hypothetical protein
LPPKMGKSSNMGPPPRIHRFRYFSVLAPHSHARTAVTALAKPTAALQIAPACGPPLWEAVSAECEPPACQRPATLVSALARKCDENGAEQPVDAEARRSSTVDPHHRPEHNQARVIERPIRQKGGERPTLCHLPQ